jgi:CheY-like chemotaxis protein/HPt (histidine-containing phosphotransfer) domain-containing protein
VLLPSFGARGHGRLARDAGISASLQKPVRQSELYNCLIKLVAEKPRLARRAAEAAGKRVFRQRFLAKASEVKKGESLVRSAARILVAEDNPINQEVTRSQLENLGYSPDIVQNGVEAVEAVKNNFYDLVLMDCQMPVMDGFEATAEIRRRQGDSRRTVIVAMTAHALEGDREKCLAAGMDDYLSKPVKIESLSEKIERWIGRPTTAPALQEKNEEISAAESSPQSVDFSMLEALGELQQPGKPDFLSRLIDLFIADTGGHLSALRRAIEKGDETAIKKEAHSIKGSAGNIGARALAKLGKEMEAAADQRLRARALISQMEREFRAVEKILTPERSARPAGSALN